MIHDHNNVPHYQYNCENWEYYAFPSFKLPIYNQDNIVTANRAFFLGEHPHSVVIENSYRVYGQSRVRRIDWRIHIALCAASLSLSFAKQSSEKVSFIEFGTGKGHTATAILDHLGSSISTFDLVDSFLPYNVANQAPDSFSKLSDAYVDSFNDVQTHFSSYQSVNLHRGVIPDILDYIPRNSYSFIHIDLNSSLSEDSVCSWICTNLATRAVILFDDTGGPGAEDQYPIHQKLATSLERPLFILPTGQSLLII